MCISALDQVPANQRMKLTGAAILVSRDMMVLQAAPAAYPYRSAMKPYPHKREELALRKAIVLGSLLVVALYLSGCDKQPASKQRADMDKKKEEEKLKTPLSVAYKKVQPGMSCREVSDLFVQECGRTRWR